MSWEAVIGLEVHAQLTTRSKIFCGCSTQFGAVANSNTCPVCLGLPGALPVMNKEAVSMAARTALALGCRVHLESIFARKNYFYPDLPKGYQISQYGNPLATGGVVQFQSEIPESQKPEICRIRIARLHLEEDAGKSVHGLEQGTGIDCNRTGVPLVEIVSEADFQSGRQAYDFLRHLRRTLRYLEVCDGNMEEGSLRCDANVSVRSTGSRSLGVKTEIKNLNSFRFVQAALEYEMKRQVKILDSGQNVEQETRLWDESAGETFPLRSKEEAHDYRYFPEPDLLPVVIERKWLERISSQMPELPDRKSERFVKTYGLDTAVVDQLVEAKNFAAYFEEAVAVCNEPQSVANWMIGDLLREMKSEQMEPHELKMTAAQLGKLVKLISTGTISGRIAKEVFKQVYRTGEDPGRIVQARGLKQITDSAEIDAIVRGVLESHPQEVEAFKAGKDKLKGFFVGQVMQETGGKANPGLVNKLLDKLLSEIE